MLALTRKKDEAIIINGNIEVKVLDIQDGKVRLGINAPREMSILREEVYLEVKENNKEAVSLENQKTINRLNELLSK